MDDLKTRIRPYLSDFRYSHTLAVAEESERICRYLGIDSTNAVIASLLHDITKEMTEEEQLSLCSEMGVDIAPETLDSPKTLHAFSAPALIKKSFPEYADDDILSAVTYHTTGRAKMTVTEMIVYLADVIEPTRQYDSCKKLREYFYSESGNKETKLEQTVLLSLEQTVRHLNENKEHIHIQTVRAYEYLSKELGV